MAVTIKLQPDGTYRVTCLAGDTKPGFAEGITPDSVAYETDSHVYSGFDGSAWHAGVLPGSAGVVASLGTDGAAPPPVGTGVRGWLASLYAMLVAAVAAILAAIGLAARASTQTDGTQRTQIVAGTVGLGDGARPMRTDPTGTTTQPVGAPGGGALATEATLGTEGAVPPAHTGTGLLGYLRTILDALVAGIGLPTGAATDAQLQAAQSGAAVVPADGADLPTVPTRALWVGVGGNVEVVLAGGGTVVFANVPAGTLLPIAVNRVRAALTTATNILALY